MPDTGKLAEFFENLRHNEGFCQHLANGFSVLFLTVSCSGYFYFASSPYSPAHHILKVTFAINAAIFLLTLLLLLGTRFRAVEKMMGRAFSLKNNSSQIADEFPTDETDLGYLSTFTMVDDDELDE